jgi:hypothetical protein
MNDPDPHDVSAEADALRARKRTVLGAVILLAAGVAVGIVFRAEVASVGRTLFPPPILAPEDRIRADARSLLDVVKADPRLPETLAGQTGFWKSWDARRALYTPAELEDLRRRLNDYLDFLAAEYTDCAEIYRTGAFDTTQSDASKEARTRIRADFGDFAEVLVAEALKLRDTAYKASPKVAGYDSSLDNFVDAKADLFNWLPRARARIDELTAPPAPR